MAADVLYGKPLPVGEVKAAGDAWEVSGYVSTFGNVDLGNDVVMPGAFDQWLADWHAKTVKTRFLFSHQASAILGKPLEMKADDRGVYVRARISKTQLGQDVHTLLRDDALDSFSIGYIPTDFAYDDAGARLLKTVAMPEFSLVALPMNEEAVVTGVKTSLYPINRDVDFSVLVTQMVKQLSDSVAEAEALSARRLTAGRKLSDEHRDAIDEFLDELEGARKRLEALLQEPQPEQVVEATGDVRAVLLALQSRRVRFAARAHGIEV